MSRETTEARFAANAADQAWREHKRDCPRCMAAVRGRQWDQLCAGGGELRTEQTRTARELAENRKLDKLPSPDQEALFPL